MVFSSIIAGVDGRDIIGEKSISGVVFAVWWHRVIDFGTGEFFPVRPCPSVFFDRWGGAELITTGPRAYAPRYRWGADSHWDGTVPKGNCVVM